MDEDVSLYLRAQVCRSVVRALPGEVPFHIAAYFCIGGSATGSTEVIVRENERYFPHDREIFSRGYTQVRKVRGDRYLDASQLLENMPDAYVMLCICRKLATLHWDGSFITR